MEPPDFSSVTVTAKDFRDSLNVTALSPHFEYYSLDLNKAANWSWKTKELSRSKALLILSEICTCRLHVESNPKPQFSYRLSNTSYQIPAQEFESLKEFTLSLNDSPRLKARLADYCWVTRRSVGRVFPEAAIDSALQIPIHLETMGTDQIFWQRALNCAASINDDKRHKIVAQKLTDALLRDSLPEASLARLISPLLWGRRVWLADPETEAKIAEKFIYHARCSKDGPLTRALLYEARQWFNLMNNLERATEMSYQIALSYIEEAKKVAALHALNLSHEAVLIFNIIPKVYRSKFNFDKLLAECKRIHTKSGLRATNEMKPIQILGDDDESVINLKKNSLPFIERIKKAEASNALLYFVYLYCPMKYQEFRSDASRVAASCFSSLFPAVTMTQGRITSSDSGRNFDHTIDHPENDDILKRIMMQMFSLRIVQFSYIYLMPSLDALRKHRITFHDFHFLLRQSDFFPEERRTLVAEALLLGFSRKLGLAMYLLAPQIEHAVRMKLKDHDKITTHTDEKGITHEIGLSALMENFNEEIATILGEDLAFEIRFLFCEAAGPNVRNLVAHGLINDFECEGPQALYVWWFALRMLFPSREALQEDVTETEGSPPDP